VASLLDRQDMVFFWRFDFRIFHCRRSSATDTVQEAGVSHGDYNEQGTAIKNSQSGKQSCY